MGHDHRHDKSESWDIGFAFALNLVFALLELVGGFLTNSLAIMADAVHDLGDSAALGSAWLLERLSVRKGNATFSYGYRRFSLLGALISASFIMTGSAFIIFHAVPRLFRPEHVHAPGMLAFAAVGIVVNGVAALRLKGAQGMNAKMAAWHLLEDVLGWCAVLVAGMMLLFWDIPVLDPALSIVIALYVLFNVAGNVMKTFGIFMQAVPADADIAGIEQSLRRSSHVMDIHHTHVWSLDGAHHVLTTHVVVDNTATREEIMDLKEHIRTVMHEHGMSHTTVEIEYADEECRIRGHTCNMN